MKLKLIAVGKPKSRPLLEMAEEYARRVGKYCPFEVKFEKSEETALAKIGSAEKVVLLDERGLERTSRETAAWLQKMMNSSAKSVVLFIGGPDGASTALKKRASETISLSRMTLSHELALVVALEQIYRAFSILKNEPYHRD